MRKSALALLASILSVGTAQAHVTLAQPEGAIGGSYLATFRVPHGCGASATVKVRVRIPEGVVSVKPMPKPGWQIDMVKGKYDKPYAVYHGNVTEGAKEVSWGGGKLPDDYYDEFTMAVFLTST